MVTRFGRSRAPMPGSISWKKGQVGMKEQGDWKADKEEFQVTEIEEARLASCTLRSA